MQLKDDNCFMSLAIDKAIESVGNAGGPFGAVIVKDGEIIACESNSVTKDNDPTAHAEVCAIRAAARRLGTFDLSGCVLYASCEPCPMCLSAMYWARISSYCYANTKEDAASIGFADDFIYKELDLKPEYRSMKRTQLMHQRGLDAFVAWSNKPDKTEY